tara:strand:+ start:736 stop:1548 length:813 start_codon:yes stop_codon:yes gene_type:complete
MKYQSYVGIELENTSAELEQLKRDGYFIKEKLLSDDLCLQISKELDLLWEQQVELYGEGLLKTIGDWGQIRGMMEHSKPLQDFIINKDIHFWVDQIVGDTSILHLQNGIVLHPSVGHNQAKYHKDFAKDFLSSKTLSLNTFIAIDDFTVENGGTYVVPGTHNFIEKPSEEYIEANKVQITCPKGTVIFFDSTLWHAGGQNNSKDIRRAVNMQWTKPFIKQQLDYPVIMDGKVFKESKLGQKLGMWTIPPKSVSEYRVTDPKLRTYRGGQG